MQPAWAKHLSKNYCILQLSPIRFKGSSFIYIFNTFPCIFCLKLRIFACRQSLETFSWNSVHIAHLYKISPNSVVKFDIRISISRKTNYNIILIAHNARIWKLHRIKHRYFNYILYHNISPWHQCAFSNEILQPSSLPR